MIDAEMSFARVEVAPAAPAKRLAPLVGLGLGAMVSMGLWGLLAMAVTHIF